MTSIERFLSEGEGETVEFLRDPSDPAAIARHVVALLNGKGGYVFVGVDDDGTPHPVHDPDKAAAALQGYLSRHVTPSTLVDVGTDVVQGSPIISVVVPGGQSGPFITDERVYIRTDASTHPADGDQLQAILQHRVASTLRWERRPSPLLETDDLDPQEIHQTVASAADRDRGTFPDFQDDPLPTLATLGLAERGALTNAADVCFGRDPARRIPQIRVRAFAYESDRGGDFVDHRTLSGPVAQVLDLAVTFVLERAPVTAEFAPDRLRRLDRAAYPTYVVREGLVNALAHRDYAPAASGVTIEVYPNRVEVWNAGTLPEGWDPRDLLTPHPSLPRNPDITHVLYLRGFMERIGRGTLKMIETCREEGLPNPKWATELGGVRLTLFSRASAHAPEANLNERQLALLGDVSPGEAITLGEYHARFASDLTERTARRDLVALADLDLLRQEGRGRGTKYIRTDRTARP